MDDITLGPDNGALTLHTAAEGTAARFGHNLQIRLGQWSAKIVFEDDVPTSVQVKAETESLEVAKGFGGVSPISSIDKKLIRRNAVKSLKASAYPEARFACQEIRKTADGFDLIGQLEIAGAERPQTISVRVAQAPRGYEVSAEFDVKQTSFNVKPYSAMLGAMKVADLVKVQLSAAIATVQG
jgi:polyisoprenoid-binding protein YceI